MNSALAELSGVRHGSGAHLSTFGGQSGGEGGLGLEAQAGASLAHVLPAELHLCSSLSGSPARTLQPHPQVLRPGKVRALQGEGAPPAGRGVFRPNPAGRGEEGPRLGRNLVSVQIPQGGPGLLSATAEMKAGPHSPGPVGGGLGLRQGTLFCPDRSSVPWRRTLWARRCSWPAACSKSPPWWRTR